eukprot:42695-Pelagomonas_calceolata.AAC.10
MLLYEKYAPRKACSHVKARMPNADPLLILLICLWASKDTRIKQERSGRGGRNKQERSGCSASSGHKLGLV